MRHRGADSPRADRGLSPRSVQVAAISGDRAPFDATPQIDDRKPLPHASLSCAGAPSAGARQEAIGFALRHAPEYSCDEYAEVIAAHDALLQRFVSGLHSGPVRSRFSRWSRRPKGCRYAAWASRSDDPGNPRSRMRFFLTDGERVVAPFVRVEKKLGPFVVTICQTPRCLLRVDVGRAVPSRAAPRVQIDWLLAENAPRILDISGGISLVRHRRAAEDVAHVRRIPTRTRSRMPSASFVFPSTLASTARS